ncbi:hypothetical protein VaNZ11_013923 [Volvox africanus]|uniref:OTU domain-containing protein n=1 Tax=Volvox africanus TaxID=51714 RepID=A0ABQ5SJ05_9CHLO|nr:hypothetical protein VaNZ11_013923 [Volvox africanus]
MDFAINLCLRPKAVEVVTVSNDVTPPVVPEDSTLRGRAAEMHRQLSHMKVPIVAPRDQLTINLDFDNLGGQGGSPKTLQTPGRNPSATAAFASHEPHATSSCAISRSPAPPDPNVNLSGVSAAAVAVGPEELAGLCSGAAGDAGTTAGKEKEEAGGGGRSSGFIRPAVGSRRASTSSTNGSAASGPLGACGGGRVSWIEGPYTRGFVRVKSVRAPEGLSWTHSRKCLEVLLTAERSTRSSGYLSHEQRLRDRLERLNLEMVVVAGDGNCQFRSVSNELYGTQEHHAAIRHQAVSHILAQRDAFEAFLGEDFDQYVRQMERSGTWGDELTLTWTHPTADPHGAPQRAMCDSFGLTVHVVTSEEDHWYLTYEPKIRKLDREIFLTYIAPIHYNSIRRQSSLMAMALTISRSFRKVSLGVHSGGGGGAANSAPASPSGTAIRPAADVATGGNSSGQRRAGNEESGFNGHVGDSVVAVAGSGSANASSRPEHLRLPPPSDDKDQGGRAGCSAGRDVEEGGLTQFGWRPAP